MKYQSAYLLSKPLTEAKFDQLKQGITWKGMLEMKSSKYAFIPEYCYALIFDKI